MPQRREVCVLQLHSRFFCAFLLKMSSNFNVDVLAALAIPYLSINEIMCG